MTQSPVTQQPTGNETRRAASAIVAEIAERLRDPAAVVAQTTGRGEAVEVDGEQAPLWTPQSLARGYPGIALLFAELGHHDPDSRYTAHRYVELAAREPETNALAGQLDGLCAVAVATRVAAHNESDYATLLHRLDQHVMTSARRLIAMHATAQTAGEPTRPVIVDALSGLAGLGRYLLGRLVTAPTAFGPADPLLEALSCLSSLRHTVMWHGVEVPGWWYHRTPLLAENEAGAYREGCATFGLSHGIAGPLALLALAWQAGFRAPGQDEAAHAITEWLLLWREADEHGWYWPAQIPLSHYRDRSVDKPHPARIAWCHGSWGIAQAILLAGEAFGRPDWTAGASEVIHATLARARFRWNINDDSLCHGWASALHQLCRIAWRTPHSALTAAADEVAARLIDDFRPDAPFGYRYQHPSGESSDLPSLLEGASGIALALHAYGTDRPPASGWDSVLLLS